MSLAQTIKDFFNEIGRILSEKVEIITKVMKECNINLIEIYYLLYAVTFIGYGMQYMNQQSAILVF